MAAAEWYKDWFNSAYYHKLYFNRDEAEAQRFIRNLLQHLHPPAGARMLDAACGRGRHSKFLAAQGFDVTGIDISVDSIREAKEAEADNLQFFVHDMRLPFWINYFDYAFNFFTSFGYFHTQREHDDTIRTLAQGLKKGGALLIDYLNTDYVSARLVPEEIKEIDGTTYHIKRWQDEHYFYKEIMVTDADLPQPLRHTEQVAKFTLPQFEQMLHKQGLKTEACWGNYSLESFNNSTSPRLILLARK